MGSTAPKARRTTDLSTATTRRLNIARTASFVLKTSFTNNERIKKVLLTSSGYRHASLDFIARKGKV